MSVIGLSQDKLLNITDDHFLASNWSLVYRLSIDRNQIKTTISKLSMAKIIRR